MSVRVPISNLYQWGGPPVSVWANGFSRLKPASSTWDQPFRGKYNQGELYARPGYHYPKMKAPRDNFEMATSQYPTGALQNGWEKPYTGGYNKGELRREGPKYPKLNRTTLKSRLDQFMEAQTPATGLEEQSEERLRSSVLQSAKIPQSKKYSMGEILTSLNQMRPLDPLIKDMLETTIRLEMTKQSRPLTSDEEEIERVIKAKVGEITEQPLKPIKKVEPSRMPRQGELPPASADIVTSEDREKIKQLGLFPGDDLNVPISKLEKTILESENKRDIEAVLNSWAQEISDYSKLEGSPKTDLWIEEVKTQAIQNILLKQLEQIKSNTSGKGPDDLLNLFDQMERDINTMSLDELIEVVKDKEMDKAEKQIFRVVSEYEEKREAEIKKVEKKIESLERELKQTNRRKNQANRKNEKRRLKEAIYAIKKDIKEEKSKLNYLKNASKQSSFKKSKQPLIPSSKSSDVSLPPPPRGDVLQEEQAEERLRSSDLQKEEEEKEEEGIEPPQISDVKLVGETKKKKKIPRTRMQMKEFRDMLEVQKNTRKNTAGYISSQKLLDKALEFGIVVPWKHHRRREQMIEYLLQKSQT